METTIPPPPELERLLGRVAMRLRLRHAIGDAVRGLWIGVVLAAILLLLSRVVWLGDQPWMWAAAAVAACGLGGLGLGASRRCLDETGCALLVDRGLGTREQIVSALEASRASALAGDVASTGSALAYALVDRGRELAEELDPAAAVPLVRRRSQRRILALIPALGVLPALLLLPRVSPASFPHRPGQDEQVVEEGRQLAERIREIEEQSGVELPAEVRDQLDELAEQLLEEELTPEEARERLDEMRDQLAQFQEELARDSAADDLQRAAEELADNPITEDLAEALDTPDLERAAREAERLAEKAADASAAEQQAAAGAMRQAAQAVAESDPELAQKLRETADAMDGGQGEPGQQGEGGLTPEQARQLAEQLRQMQESGLAETLAEDEELMKMSQRLNGALESSS